MKDLIKNKLLYLGYSYSNQTKAWHTKIRGVNYSIFGRKLTFKGLMQQHIENIKHNRKLIYY